MNIDQILSEAKKYKDSENYQKAIDILESNLNIANLSPDFYRELGDIYALQGNRDKEFFYRSKVIDAGSVEPADYYDLSRCCFVLGKSAEAVLYSNHCLDQCLKNNFMYYFQSANFWKSLALIDLGLLDDANVAADFLDDDYKTYVSGRGMVSKEMIKSKIKKDESKKKQWKFD